MASNQDRDRLFPATSIGRTGGSRLHRVPSNDLISAHPLLSSSQSPSPSPSSDSTPRYVPYTPRQRVAASPTTTGTTIHPSSPQQQGDATSRLQLVNLKAAAQNIGLDTVSVGWAILEKLVQESDHHNSEWNEIWTAVTTGKATLLLPLEPSLSHDKDRLTPEFVKDHVVLCDGPSRKNAPIMTLSGLRGTLSYNTLTLRSTLHPSTKTHQDLLHPSTRSQGLSALPDLPLISPSISYPTYTVPSHSPSLPLPRRAAPTKPTLPPRPSPTPAASSSTSRITNPFASLFGNNGPSTRPSTPAPVPASPTGSLRSLDSTSAHHEPVIEIAAFTIDRAILRPALAKDLNKAVRREVEASLEVGVLVGMPAWVGDRVHTFTEGWYPFVKEDTITKAKAKSAAQEGGKWVIPRTAETPESTAERVQDFYLGLEQELRVSQAESDASFLGRSRKEPAEGGERGVEGGHGEDKGKEEEKRIQEKIDSEGRIKECMDVVERTLCGMFYDRLYMQPTSDDGQHDETLSSRVAALNMLDLGLEHLDIQVDQGAGAGGEDLDKVIKACGETLSQLKACRSPGDKAALLVEAHKGLVDGLSRLPPIRLMSEEESTAQKAKSAQLAQAKTKADAPPREKDGRLRIMVPLDSSAAVESGDGDVEVPTRGGEEDDDKTPHARAHPISASPVPVPVIIEPHATTQSASSPSPSSSTPNSTPTPTPVSSDVLLPLLIFSVVSHNPPHLVSSLLYTQRFRNTSIGGEESFCLVNLLAVAEFLENVDLAALGLADTEKVLSAKALTPIPIRVGEGKEGKGGQEGVGLRERVEQANKVITGVVDSSFGMLRSFLPTAPVPPNPAVDPVLPQNHPAPAHAPVPTEKPGFGLLRRESGFSIRSITAALDMGRSTTKSGEEAGQQLVSVSRPVHVKEGSEEESGTEESGGEGETSDEETGDEDRNGGETDGGEREREGGSGSARSIRSFESMLDTGKKGKGEKKGKLALRARKSLTDRLASMSSLAGLKNTPPNNIVLAETPASSRPPSPSFDPHTSNTTSHPPMRLAPPIARFVECSAGDLRLSEVGELLRDYRRLVEGIRAVKGFDE
ncbi:hypothetical protein DXG01_016145 [Tephrocybe rancida]|nr:hypothetical protein DXG01_016145 [Tephrocybe rancida]